MSCGPLRWTRVMLLFLAAMGTASVLIALRPAAATVLQAQAAGSGAVEGPSTAPLVASPAPSPSSSTSPSADPGSQACDVGPVLTTFCHIGQGIDGLPGKAAGSAASDIGTSIVQAVTNWVASGAAWTLDQVTTVLDESTTPDVTSDWFRRDYRTMAELAALCIAVFLFAATIQGLLRGEPGAIVRAYVLHAPLAIVGTLLAGALVERALAVTDAMSASVSTSTHDDIASFTGHVVDALAIAGGGHAGASLFVIFLGAVGVAITALVLWLELLVRQAAVDICVLFLPLTLSASVWPETAAWTRRLLHTLAAIILSKFVIVAVLALSVSALAAGAAGGGVKAILVGVVLLALSAYCPWAVLRLLPALSASASAGVVGLGRRGVAWAKPRAYRSSALAEHLVRGRSATAVGGGRPARSLGFAGAGAVGAAGGAAALVATRAGRTAMAAFPQAAAPGWTAALGRRTSAPAAEPSPSLNSTAERPSPDAQPRLAPRTSAPEEETDV